MIFLPLNIVGALRNWRRTSIISCLSRYWVGEMKMGITPKINMYWSFGWLVFVSLDQFSTFGYYYLSAIIVSNTQEFLISTKQQSFRKGARWNENLPYKNYFLFKKSSSFAMAQSQWRIFQNIFENSFLWLYGLGGRPPVSPNHIITGKNSQKYSKKWKKFPLWHCNMIKLSLLFVQISVHH